MTKRLAVRAGAMLLLGSSLSGAATNDPVLDAWYKRYKMQENVPKPGEMLLNTDKEPDMNEGFVALFNGKDRTGWTQKGGDATFVVKNGVIGGTVVPDWPSTYLCTDRADFSDIIFTCELKWEVDLNSGIMFRVNARKNGEVE